MRDNCCHDGTQAKERGLCRRHTTTHTAYVVYAVHQDHPSTTNQNKAKTWPSIDRDGDDGFPFFFLLQMST